MKAKDERITVHALELGAPLCHFSTETPGCWPADQRWTAAREVEDLDKITCESCKAVLRARRDAVSYVLTRREMRALRDYWTETSVSARKDGDLDGSESAFQAAWTWHQRYHGSTEKLS